jgi:hypothetical protein
MKINFREPSTKRGIVMLLTGGIVLYQLFTGDEVRIDDLAAKVEWWIGIGITVAGVLGLLPDTSSSSPALPPIEFVGRAESGTASGSSDATAGVDADRTADRTGLDLQLRGPELPTERNTESSSNPGWNG